MDGLNSPTPNSPHEPSEPGSQTSLSIAVADDVEGIRELIRLWAHDAGHRVVCASDGASLITIMRSNRFDLVITDVLMPDGDGLEVILELRKNRFNPRILAISGGGRHWRAPDCLKVAKGLGAHAILQKPFTRHDLFAAIAVAMSPNATKSSETTPPID